MNVVSCYPGRTPTNEEVRACGHNVQIQLAAIQPKYMLVCGNVALNALVGGQVKGRDMRGAWWRYDVGRMDAEPGSPGTSEQRSGKTRGVNEGTGHSAQGNRGQARKELGEGDIDEYITGVGDEDTKRSFAGEGNVTNRLSLFEGSLDGPRVEAPRVKYIWCLATIHPAAVLRNPNLLAILESDLEIFRFYSLGVFDPPESQWCVVCGVGKQVPIVSTVMGGRCKKHMPKEEKAWEKRGGVKVSREQGELI